jgi:hypothetical protein
MLCRRSKWGSRRVAGTNLQPGQIAIPPEAVTVTFYGPANAGAWSVAWRRGPGDPPVVWFVFPAGGVASPAVLLIPPDARILEYGSATGADAFVAWGE